MSAFELKRGGPAAIRGALTYRGRPVQSETLAENGAYLLGAVRLHPDERDCVAGNYGLVFPALLGRALLIRAYVDGCAAIESLGFRFEVRR